MFRAAMVVLTVLCFVSSAAAQDFYHPLPWRSAADVTCVRAPSERSRAELDEALAATGRGESRGTALDLIATCAVPRREVAEAFNRGGLVHHGSRDYETSARFFFGAVMADPSFLPARFNLACAYARLGRAAAAVAEISQTTHAGAEGRPWLERVRTDPDLASIRTRQDVGELLSSQWTPGRPLPAPVPRFGPPAPSGPVWQPMELGDWRAVRDFLAESPRYGRRRGYQRGEAWAPSHPELAGLEPFSDPMWWRPEPGIVFLVIPFTIPGPNRREGTMFYLWTGSEYLPACREYCDEMSFPRTREARFRTSRSNVVRLLRCADGSSRCVIKNVDTNGANLYFRPGSVLENVTP